MSEAQLIWFMGCLLLVALVIGYPSIMIALALLREQSSGCSLSSTGTSARY